MSLTVNENKYGLTVSETPTHSLTVSGTSAPLTIASDDLTITVDELLTSLITVTGSTDPSLTVQDNNILLTIDQSTGSSSSATNPFDQDLNTTDSPTFAAITVSGTVDGRDLSVDGAKLDGISAQANKYVHPTYTSRSINTSGASVLDEFTSDVAGHVTNITTRTLTLADLGYTGATDANKFIHPTETSRSISVSATGAEVVDAIGFTSNALGHVTSASATKRTLTLADLGYTGAADANKFIHPTETSRSISVSATGAEVVDAIGFTSNALGHVTSASATKRTLTLADLGYTGAADANKYVLPTSFTARNIDTSGAHVLDTFTSDTSGRVTGITTRPLSLSDIGYTGATNADVTPSWVPSTNPNYLTAASTDLDSRYYTETETNGFLNLKANLASPTFTGTPKAPTPTLSDNSTNIATTEYVKGQTIAYSSLSGKPTIPSGNQIIDWTQDQGSTDIHVNNLPTIPYSSISGTPAAAQIVDWTVDQGSTDIHADNISEASVTQHQGELSITELQISDLGTYLTATSTDLDSRYYTETEINQFLNLKANKASPSFTGNVIIGGNLTVNGTTTTINSTTVQVDDKNIELGTVDTPTDATADGGGITLKGATDKTINWVNSTSAWTFSERVAIPAGSAASPSLTFSNDTDTGIFRELSGTSELVSFSTEGSKRAHISSAGIFSQANVYSAASGQFRNFSGVWKATTGVTGNGFQFVSPDATALTISSTGNATFAGNITLAGPSNEIIKSNGSIRLNIDSNADQSDRIFIVSTGANSELFRVDESGNGTFAGNVILGTGDNLYLNGTTGLRMLHDGSNALFINQTAGDFKIQNSVSDKDIIFRGNDGGSSFTALTLDMSGGGYATFASGMSVGAINTTGTLDISSTYPRINLNDTNHEDDWSIINDDGNFTIYNVDDNVHALRINSSNNATFAGNVGIGTTGPNALLNVQGDSDPTILINAETGNSANSGKLAFAETDGGAHQAWMKYDGSANRLEIGTAQVSQAFVINRSDGKVGIGTSSPDQKLEVAGNAQITASDPRLVFEDTSGSTYNADWKYKDNIMRFVWGGGEKMSITSNGGITIGPTYTASAAPASGMIMEGRLGIGTSSPAAKLDVSVTSGNAWMNLINGSETAFRLTTYNNGTNNGTNAYAFKHGLYYNTTENAAVTFYRGGGSTGGFLTFTTNAGSERMRISSSGNVGIGTTSPSQKLDVNGSAIFRPSGTTDTVSFLSLGSSQSRLVTTNNFAIWAGGSESVRFLSNGNVGIGTTSPAAKLEVNSGGGIHLSDDTAGRTLIIKPSLSGAVHEFTSDNTAAGYSFSNNASELMRITSAGNVGIGTTAPSQKLSVAGSIDAITAMGVAGQWASSQIRLETTNTVNTTGWQGISFDTSTANNYGWSIGANRSIDGRGSFRIYEHINNATGAERFTIKQDGNVGIGTTNPANLLHLNSNNNVGPTIVLQNSQYSSYINAWGSSAASGRTSRFEINASTTDFAVAGDSIRFQIGDVGDAHEKMRIDSSGNVGIGTTSPSSYFSPNLVVKAGANLGGITIRSNATSDDNYLMFADGTSGNERYRGFINYNHSNDSMAIATAAATAMFINSSGNVGIGTTIPTAPLDVLGVRAGRDWSIANRATIRLDANGNGSPSDILFGHTAAANQSSWTGAYWSLSSRGSSASNKFYFYRASGNPSNATEAVIMAFDPNGKVGINTTSPNSALDIRDTQTGGASEIKLFNLDQGNTATQTSALVMSPDVRANGVKIVAVKENADFSSSANKDVAITFSPVLNNAAAEKMRITSDGNVGIGVTDPDSKLEIKGSGTGGGGTLRVKNSNDSLLLQVTDNGVVSVPNNYFYVSSSAGAYVQNALRVRGSLLNDQGTLSITGDVQFDSYTLFVDSAYDRVGVGSSSPSYKLDVSGGIRAGGKVTYHKSAGSLTTTGYAVAGLTSFPLGNGASAGFTFTSFGHTGSYQKIVYSCYNVSGTWNTQKVIDEGTNDFDVTASANGSTITFTFKSRSGTKSYTPRVSVEAFGSSINNTYA